MSDLIDRQQAIDALRKLSQADGYINLPHEYVTDVIRGLPTVQPEIIRCGECKYYTPVMAHCEIRGKGLYLIRGMEDFCSRAERRTDE